MRQYGLLIILLGMLNIHHLGEGKLIAQFYELEETGLELKDFVAALSVAVGGCSNKLKCQKICTFNESCPAAEFDFDSVVGGYGYRLKVLCRACGTREDVTDPISHGGYPHR